MLHVSHSLLVYLCIKTSNIPKTTKSYNVIRHIARYYTLLRHFEMNLTILSRHFEFKRITFNGYYWNIYLHLLSQKIWCKGTSTDIKFITFYNSILIFQSYTLKFEAIMINRVYLLSEIALKILFLQK